MNKLLLKLNCKMRKSLYYFLEGLLLISVFALTYLLILIFNNMKSEQFKHNLAKHKRQAKHTKRRCEQTNSFTTCSLILVKSIQTTNKN
jgi:hypothetical protein